MGWLANMASKRTHGDGHPAFPVKPEVYKYDAATDAAVQSQFQPLMDIEGNRVVMPGAFKARRDAQIKRRKAQGM